MSDLTDLLSGIATDVATVDTSRATSTAAAVQATPPGSSMNTLMIVGGVVAVLLVGALVLKRAFK